MDFSIIIPTVGRSSLTRAVKSALDQTTDKKFQVIVVNDSDKPLVAVDWQTDTRVQIIETPRIERSGARNRGARIADGAFLIFLDDDDWLLPDALEHFANNTSEADWLLGNCRMVSPNGKLLTTMQFEGEGNCAVQAMAGEWVPLQAMCIRRELFWKVGGFGRISLGEDRDLASRLALHADLKQVHAPLAVVVQDARSSTSVYSTEQTQRYWQARDALLEDPMAYARLWSSAEDAYWRGRLMRLYLNAVVLQLKAGRRDKALARLRHAARPSMLADAVRPDAKFWRGALTPHTSHARTANNSEQND